MTIPAVTPPTSVEIAAAVELLQRVPNVGVHSTLMEVMAFNSPTVRMARDLNDWLQVADSAADTLAVKITELAARHGLRITADTAPAPARDPFAPEPRELVLARDEANILREKLAAAEVENKRLRASRGELLGYQHLDFAMDGWRHVDAATWYGPTVNGHRNVMADAASENYRAVAVYLLPEGGKA
ncbi:hypothetical protein ACFWPK_34460 [Nocardia sp. NPDC058519]|uniref:hypothetical protein n=1 Tax=Nocardia sp. NPDC058519 TaxID=3346535 RepID=UPI003668F726